MAKLHEMELNFSHKSYIIYNYLDQNVSFFAQNKNIGFFHILILTPLKRDKENGEKKR